MKKILSLFMILMLASVLFSCQEKESNCRELDSDTEANETEASYVELIEFDWDFDIRHHVLDF